MSGRHGAAPAPAGDLASVPEPEVVWWGVEGRPPYCSLMVLGTRDLRLATRLAWEHALDQEWPAQASDVHGMHGRDGWTLPAGRQVWLREVPCTGCEAADEADGAGCPLTHLDEVDSEAGAELPAVYFEADADRRAREHAAHGHPRLDEVWDRDRGTPLGRFDPACSWCRGLQARRQASDAVDEQRRRWAASAGTAQQALHQLLAAAFPAGRQQRLDLDDAVVFVVDGLRRRGWRVDRDPDLGTAAAR